MEIVKGFCLVDEMRLEGARDDLGTGRGGGAKK
jgi:hypothetical protein